MLEFVSPLGVEVTVDLQLLVFIDIDKDILLALLEDEHLLVEVKDLPLQLACTHLHLQGLPDQIKRPQFVSLRLAIHAIILRH